MDHPSAGRLARIAEAPPHRARAALAFGAGGFFLVYFGQVVLGVVQPEIQSDLGLDHDEALWVVNAFMLGLAALVPLGGRLADVVGPRRAILAGLAAMALGAAGAALAPGFGALVASLAVQGSGAGVAIAGTIAIVTAAYPREHRGQAVGRYVGLGVLALPIAPVAAGALIDAGEWRLTFWLALALTLTVLAVGAFGLPREPRRDERVDAGAGLIAVAGLGLALGGAVEATAWGWTSPATIAVMAVGIALLVGFVAREARSRQPLLDLALVRDQTIGGAATALFFTQMGTSGVAIFVPIYLLTIVRLDPLITGVAMLPAMVFPPALSPLAGGLADRIGTRGLAVAGGTLAAAGCAWLALFAPDQEYGVLVPGLVLFGVGIPIAFAAVITSGSAAAPERERGAAAGLLNTARWVGATVGTVAFGAALDAVRESRLDELLAPRRLDDAQLDAVDRLVLADEDATVATTRDLGGAVVDAVADAFASGYRAGFWVCCGAFALAALVSAVLPSVKPRLRG